MTVELLHDCRAQTGASRRRCHNGLRTTGLTDVNV